MPADQPSCRCLFKMGPWALALLVICPLPSRSASLLRGCRRGAGEDRVQAWLPGPPAGHGLRSRRPLRPFRCERGIRGGSEGSRRTRAHDLDLWRVAARQMDLN